MIFDFEQEHSFHSTYLRCSDPRFRAADGPRQDGAGLVVARQDLGDAAVGHPQLPADVTWPGQNPFIVRD